MGNLQIYGIIRYFSNVDLLGNIKADNFD
jgi:hypothetical protein